MERNRDDEVTRELASNGLSGRCAPSPTFGGGPGGESGEGEGAVRVLSSHCTDIECLDRLDRLELSTLLSAGLAHDLASPLVAMQVDLTRLARWLDELEDSARTSTPSPRVAAAMARCRWVAGALDKTAAFMVRLVTDFGRATLGQPAGTAVADVQDAVETAARFAQGVIGNRAVISMRLEPRLRVEVDHGTLVRALVNLTVNAAEAFVQASPRNQVQVVASSTERAVNIDVIDNGPGVDPEVRERLFQPFVTTRRGDRVRGLGLAVARTLLREAGGDLELLTTDRTGTTFRCTLPRHRL
jgi:two-component system C4-dicarboxylate transport sensor histidine kinase DctB